MTRKPEEIDWTADYLGLDDEQKPRLEPKPPRKNWLLIAPAGLAVWAAIVSLIVKAF